MSDMTSTAPSMLPCASCGGGPGWHYFGCSRISAGLASAPSPAAMTINEQQLESDFYRLQSAFADLLEWLGSRADLQGTITQFVFDHPEVQDILLMPRDTDRLRGALYEEAPDE